MPVHIYGQVADMDSILELAERYGLVVVEDACQAQGAAYCSGRDGWQRAGSFGKAGAFSFYPGKNLGACGEAGAVTTDDEQVARTIRMLREHGQVQKYYHDLEGYNGRLDAIQAAFLRIKLRRLDDWNDQRRAAAARYASPAVGRRRRLTLPFEPLASTQRLSPVRGPHREPRRAGRAPEGATASTPACTIRCRCTCRTATARWGYAAGDLAGHRARRREILSLPMFPGITAEQQERVAAAIEAHASASTR